MRILLLDTSSKYLSLAVAQDYKILSELHRSLDRKHSAQLVFFIEKILKKARISLERIDGFCVSKGPGSFTGLRIGITAIKGLAFVMRKPVVAIPSLDILAQNAISFRNKMLPELHISKGASKTELRKTKDLPLQVCPIVDAKQNKIYASLYQAGNGKVIRSSGYLLLSLPQLLKKLKGEILFLGDAIMLYREEIRKSKNIKPIFAEEKYWYPKVSRAVTLAMQRFYQGRTEDVNSLTPLYLYPKECQIKPR